jgi:GNAT superfamily N-acetyltransferase
LPDWIVGIILVFLSADFDQCRLRLTGDSMELASFTQEHARQVAAIHIEGQPETLLTRLGPDFLEALYRAMADSSWCFGSVLVDGDTVAGVGIAALDTGQFFRDVKRHHWQRLIWPAVKQSIRHPSLIGKVVQSLWYPTKLAAPPGEAEILFMGLRRAYMRQGIGPRLLQHLLDEAHERGCLSASAIIDRRNRAIRWMVATLPGVYVDCELELYGKTMLVYKVPLPLRDDNGQ